MKWLLGNPGSCPEIQHLATYLAATTDVEYFVSVYFSPNSRLQKTPFWKLASRRQLASPTLEVAKKDFLASALEMTFVGMSAVGAPPKPTEKVLHARSQRFSRALRGRTKALSPDFFFARSSVALHALREKHYGFSVIDYPIVHHDWLNKTLQAENEAYPQLAEQSQMVPDYLRPILDEEIELADSVLTLSPIHTRSFVEAGVSPERLIEVPLGVDTQLFPFKERERSDKLRVVFVGQATLRKGIQFFIETAKQMDRRYFSFSVVGVASDAIKTALADADIDYSPSVSRAALADVYGKYDVFYMPTLAEGFPQTPLEALATGLPVLISAECYGADGPVNDQTGYLIDPRNIDEAVSALAELKDDREKLESMSQYATKVANEYTWTRFAERLSGKIQEKAALK